MQDLTSLRAQIDEIDEKILLAIKARIEVVKQVAAYKKAHGLPFLDEERKRAILENKIQRAKEENIDPEFIRDLYQLIHDFSLKLEENDDNS